MLSSQKSVQTENRVAHGLYQLSHSVWCGGVLQDAVLTCVSKAALYDCNSNNVIGLIYNTFLKKNRTSCLVFHLLQQPTESVTYNASSSSLMVV
jgi:hypothetical protein